MLSIVETEMRKVESGGCGVWGVVSAGALVCVVCGVDRGAGER